MNKRTADRDHSLLTRSLAAAQRWLACLVLIAGYLWGLELMLQDLEEPNEHRFAPAQFHGKDIMRARPDARESNEEFAARD